MNIHLFDPCVPISEPTILCGPGVFALSEEARSILNSGDTSCHYPIPWNVIPELYYQQYWYEFINDMKNEIDQSPLLEYRLEDQVMIHIDPAIVYFSNSSQHCQTWDIGLMTNLRYLKERLELTILGPTLVSSDHALHQFFIRNNIDERDWWISLVTSHLTKLSNKALFTIAMPVRDEKSTTHDIFVNTLGAQVISFMFGDIPFSIYKFIPNHLLQNQLLTKPIVDELLICTARNWVKHFNRVKHLWTDQNKAFMNESMRRWYSAIRETH